MEKAQFRVLYRQFLFRLVDLELLSSHAQGDSSKLLGQFASLLIFLGILLSLGAIGGPRAPAAKVLYIWSMEHMLIATTMLVAGLFAVLSWDSTFPNRADVLILAPLPVRTRTLFLAKVAAVGAAMSLTVACLHALAGVVWPVSFATQLDRDFDAPALNALPAVPPVSAAALGPLLQRNLAPALSPDMGIAIGVYKRGERRVYSYGATKLDSIYPIGSVSKTFTSLLLAQMILEGRARLDEPVRELIAAGTVPRPPAREITLQDLATHRSGLPPMQINFNPQTLAKPDAYPTASLWKDLARYGVAREPNPPFIYSNFGYAVLGEALAARAGMSFPELVASKIAAPLGLRDTAIDLTPEREERLLQGFNAEHQPQRLWYMDAFNGAGGLRSTAPDMLTFLEANLRRATPAMRLQQEPRATVAADLKIALGWLYSADTGTYFHNGVITGFSTHARFNPRHDYAVIVLINQSPGIVMPADVLALHIEQRLTGAPAISFATVKIPGGIGLMGVLRFYAAYWMAMMAAAAFMFCCVLGLQGVAAQLLPRRLFLRVSSLLQLAAFCVLVCAYFSEPLMVTGPTLMVANGRGLLGWSPSYWFLGLLQQWSGSPAMTSLAHRAWTGLAVAVSVTAIAYALSYFRTLRQIVEEPDILPAARRIFRMPPIGAIEQFTVKTLLRSRQHRIVLAFYLGIGFALTILLVKAPAAQNELADSPAGSSWGQVNTPLLAASIVMLCFAIIGTRVVFSLPKDLRANWIFRITSAADRPLKSLQAAQRRALLLLSAVPVCAATAGVAFREWPMQAAVGHLLVLVLLASVLSDICLYSLHRIPFTCSYLPGKSRIHMAFLGAAGLLWTITLSVRYERQALERFSAMAPLLIGLLVIAIVTRTLAAYNAAGGELRFEEEEAGTVQVLGLR
jgi:CubicO group peptidase (beta-lactamase class C family)